MTAPADFPDAVRIHYEAGVEDQSALLSRLGALVDQMPRPLTARSLAALDQFHIGGLAATTELARRAGAGSDLRVLDIGSGLGGPSRYLAEEHGCKVVDVDLSPIYVAVAAMLAEKAGLAGEVRCKVAARQRCRSLTAASTLSGPKRWGAVHCSGERYSNLDEIQGLTSVAAACDGVACVVFALTQGEPTMRPEPNGIVAGELAAPSVEGPQ